MRRFVLTLFMILGVLSCSDYRATEKLMDRAESLMDSAPDSALSIMSSIDMHSLKGERQTARCALLYTMAQDKAYVVETNDSIALIARDYYRNHGSKDYRMKSAFYLGVVHHSALRYTEAIYDFQMAEPFARELSDYHYQGLIYWHIRNIYADNYDQVKSLEYAHKALNSYKQYGDSLAIGYSYLDLAVSYLSNEKWEKAKQILDSLEQSGPKHQALRSYTYLRLAKIITLYSLPEIEKALYYYRCVADMGVIPFKCDDISYMAILSERNGDSQSADYYLDIVSSRLKSPSDSVEYYNALWKIHSLRDDVGESATALESLLKYQNRAVSSQLERSVSHSMETYFHEQADLEKARSESRLYLLIIMAIVGLLIITMLFYTLRMRKNQIVEDMAAINEVSEDLARQRERGDEMSRIVESLISDRVGVLQQLSKAYFSWEDNEIKKREHAHGIDTRDELISEFRRQIGGFRNDTSFLSTVERSLNVADDGILIKARRLLGPRKKADYTILTLLLAGFSVKSISFLLRMSEPAVRMQKSRLTRYFVNLHDNEGAMIAYKLRS